MPEKIPSLLEKVVLAKKFVAKIPIDFKAIKGSLEIEQDTLGVFVVAVAIHNDESKNSLMEIPTQFGNPISNEIHDFVRDCYRVECADFFQVGHVPINYRLRMTGILWTVDVPLPLAVVRKYLSEEGKRAFDDWLAKHKDDHTIELIQTLGVF